MQIDVVMDTISFRGKTYPRFQATGNAARFIIPLAKQVCHRHGLDIGCGEMDWKFPGAIPVDLKLNNEFHAMNIPQCSFNDNGKWDFIFSSHLLEHLPDWVGALDYWKECLVPRGTLFLYLPHPKQFYWRPYHNRKHLSILYPKDIKDYLKQRDFKNVFVSGRDLNFSFAAMAEK